MKTPRNPSHMPHVFGAVPSVSAPRSTFNLDRTKKTTLDAGYLVPFYVDEVLPGDTFSVRSFIVARLSTPVAPIMDNIYIDTHYFAVPNRLLWDNWERFNGAQDNPGDSTDFLCPVVTAPVGGFTAGDLYCNMGMPVGVDNIQMTAFHTRAYNFIFNEFFRDQDLQDSVRVDTGDGPDDPDDYVLLRRCKRPDYFTTCRPFLQKGPEVTLPLGSVAPVITDSTDITFTSAGGQSTMYSKNNAGITYMPHNDNTSMAATQFGTNTGLQADLENATASTISALRLAVQLQRKYERDARSGTRYVEYLLAHWGVRSPDYRLQRPEYLGGGSQRMDMQTVPNTNVTGSNQADLGAFGLSTGGGHGFVKSFTEHCVILGLASVRSDITYQQGIPRMFSRRDVTDFALPVFAHLSEQPVFNKEIYAQGTSADDDVFGYQERYAEYRYGISTVSGKFRSDASGPLDFWHLALDFSSLPVLSSAFIQDDPPLDRVVAVSSEPHVIMDTYSRVRATRRLPVYSDPGYMDHF